MDIWVLECVKFDGTDVSIQIYSDENSAYVKAAKIARDEMASDCSDPDSDNHKEWLKLIEAIDDNDYDRALRVYNDWNGYLDWEYRYSIYVYRRNVIRSSTDTKESASVTTKVVYSSVVLPDVPCKQCGHKVTEADDSCWWCGRKNPATD